MCKNIREDIPKENIDYTYLSLISRKTNIGVIGGGKVGYIKSKNFLSKNCNVEVLSIDFIEEFKKLDNIKLIKNSYYKDFIKDKHIIVIATNDTFLNQRIKEDCEEAYKIYVYVEDYLESMAIVPVQRNLNNISFAVNTNYGNPKGSLMIAEKVIDTLREYDEFVGYSSLIRKSAKGIVEKKKDIINFVCSEDFKYIYEKKKDKIVLEMFFGKEVLNEIYRNL
ncbi:NAD(P)-dependent oxidoreductase [Clostridium sp. AL.422]|uniref:NAD(P)-dependent oxidoreductase n=1 Tax=Clostridium TaxID=1485 RepID=UPI00293DB256|nr:MULTISPECIES: NAD(P)-dependent oxidoreductase [unclassified Clostridium]MDV4149463.1 NAD(P)-dependent oxidoreductase [Clostridium sp. AL.422]